MRSRGDQVSVRRKPVMPRGFLKRCPAPARVIALIVLLVVIALVFAQEPAIAMGEKMGEPMPKQAAIAGLQEDTPEAPNETPEPPGETAEPAPSETVAPPPETTTPTPGEPSGPEPTVEETPEPGETVEPGATETPAATATAAPTATPAVLIWPTDWPLGTVRVGEEPVPPSEPLRVGIAEWLRLALAVVIISLVAIFGGRLLYRLLGSVITRQHLAVDGTLLVQLRPLLSWWLAAIGFHISVWWVGFQNERAVDLFSDLAFLAYLGLATVTVWQLVDRAIDLYADRIAAEGQAATVEKLRPIMRRWARVLILVFGILVGLGRLQVGFSVPTLLVILLGLTVGLAARDTLSDIIAGFFILIDQPFRVGDRVEVEGVETWADVVRIGLRTSALRTRHNVEIVVPNSTIGNNQVINYSYPDSRYRLQTYVDIAFGTDVERARQVMIDAVRQADFVLPGEPVEALYAEIGKSGMVFRVRWWIDFYRDWERAYDCVHTALRNALKEATIESPYPSQSLHVQVDDRTLAEVWQAWQGEGGIGLTE
jgi:MscS family membrane protein